MSSILLQQPADLFKILGHPARLEILDLLQNGEQCVCHIEATLGYRQAYISQQLAVLRQAGLIQDVRDGLNIYYRVTRPEVYALMLLARTMIGVHEPSKEPVQAECPCPKCTALKSA